MTIDRLRTLLGDLGPSATALEIAELLWLATHLPSPEEPTPASTEAVIPAEPVPPNEFELPSLSSPDDTITGPPPIRQPVHTMQSVERPGVEAVDVAIPTAPFLRRPLKLQRALRPLKRPVESTSRYEFDEAATASSAAQQPPGMPWVPSFRPSSERWLKLALVVDTGPSMQLWQPLARELRDILAHVGAFRDVRVWHLIDGPTGVLVRSGSGPGLPPATLLDPTGRQAIAVLSDCSGQHWWNRRVGRALRQWASVVPTVIVQPLPERMWHRTAAPIVSGLASTRHPAAPNVDLDFVPFDGRAPDAPGDVPIPVVEPTPRWFGDWAQLLSVPNAQIPTAMTFQGGLREGPADGLPSVPGASIKERILRFQSVASPDAMALAAHTAVSEPNLAVMRLIQHRLLHRSRPSDLAEVLLSGFLREIDGSPGQYRFIPGARKALLETLPRHASMSTATVLEAVSDEIRSRLGTHGEVFRAGLRVTDGIGRYGLAPGGKPFAEVSDEALSYLMPQSSRATVTAEPPPSLRLPDPARSTAVLIGVDRCAEEEGLVFPQVDNDLADLRRVLMDPMICGLSPDRIHTFENPTSRDVPAIIAALQTAADIRFVYFSGHSFMTHDGSLYLALDGTVTDGLRSTSLPFSDIHKVVERNVAGNNLFLFNGCHSEVGQYIDQVMTPRRLAGNLHVTTSSFAQDLVWHRQSRNTPLVEALVSALNNGIPNGHSLISVDDLSEHLRDRLTLGEHPVPLQWARTETDVNFALANNRMARAELELKNSWLERVHLATDQPTTASEPLPGPAQSESAVLADAISRVDRLSNLTQDSHDRHESELADALRELSIHLYDVQRYDEAANATRRAARIFARLADDDPDRYESRLAASLYMLSSCLSESGSHGEALTTMQRVVAIYSRLARRRPGRHETDRSAALMSLGDRLDEVGRHHEAVAAVEEAVDIRRALVEADPNTHLADLATSLNSLGLLLHQRGDIDAAVTSYRRAIQAGNAEALIHLGELYADRGETDLAMMCYRRAINKGRTDAMLNLGNLLYQHGEIGEAENWYHRAVAAGHTDAMVHLGSYIYKYGDAGEAEIWYRRAIDAGHSDAMVKLGVLLSEQGDVGQAEAWYRRAIDAGNTDAMSNLGNLLHGRGDVSQAEAWYRRAIDAGNTDTMFDLGDLLHERGRTDEAADWFRRAADAGHSVAPSFLQGVSSGDEEDEEDGGSENPSPLSALISEEDG